MKKLLSSHNNLSYKPATLPTLLCTILMAYSYIMLLLLCLPFIALVHLLMRQKKEKSRATLFPPGPKKLPVIGNLHLLGEHLHHSLWLLSHKHGPLMLLQLGTIPTLIVSSADMAREVLKDHDLSFCSRPEMLASKKYSYGCRDVAFSPYGEYWRQMRKISILELFSVKRVELFRSVREEEVSLMIDTITQSSSTPINISKAVATLSNSIICRIVMGKKYKDGEYETFSESQALLGGFFITDYFPSMGWLDKVTGAVRRLENNVGKLDNMIEKAIEEHLNPANKKPDHEDLFDVLLRVQQDASHITRDDIKGVLLIILIAGTDTTSAALVWAMSELMRNPRVIKKVQDEVRDVVGSKGKVEEGDLYSLHYLKSVVKETLRLRPPVPLLLLRETMSHCKIGGYDVLPKTRVIINGWGIGRDPKLWENPEEFFPERFMNGSVDFKGHDYHFIPFGSGRRICPAINMAITTIELALANLLYSFEWELPPGMSRDEIDMNEATGITVHKRCALHLVAKKYKMN